MLEKVGPGGLTSLAICLHCKDLGKSKLVLGGKCLKIRPEVIKPFFMLNSVDHEILNAHKYKKYQEIRHFICPDKPRMLFFPLVNDKMPTIVGSLTFMSRKNFMLS